MNVLDFGLAGLVAYGAVGLISYLLVKFGKKQLDPEVKFGLLVVIAFAVLFVPTDLSNELFEKAKLALGVGLSLSAVHDLVKRVGVGK